MTNFVKPSNLEIAARLRALAAPSRILDGIVFRVLDGVEGDVWSDLLDTVDGVWWRRDPSDRGAWDSPPRITESFDLALERKFAGVRLVLLEEQPLGDGLDPDWRPWRCLLRVSVHPEPLEGLGINPAVALLDALFQVHAVLAQENGK